VGHRGHLAIYAFGKQSDLPRATKVNEQTIYDAASLTKPLVTATLAAIFKESGQLDFEAPVSRYLPEWACGPRPELRARVSVAHLLAHAAGLPAHQDYFLKLKSHAEMVARALAEPLVYEPGTDSIYSDIDFIILGAMIERLTGRRLDQLANERIFAPLGMKDTMFRPAKSLRRRIAPTQNDPVLRRRMVHGEVHDENAWVMGGVAGHAGIFSTAPDLAIFCQMMLNGGIYAHQRILQRKTIREITAPAALAANMHSLGWVVPTENSSSGHYFSKQSFGHTGFTGTSIWIDPQKQLFVVLLANARRVRSSPQNDPIIKVRPALHDAIVKCLDLAPD
jgi:CubicO group peptidase (beta-lactamase class C family)